MALTFKSAIVTILPFVFWIGHGFALWTEFELRSIEDMNGTAGQPIFFNLRQKRIKKGLYGITGTVVITDPFNEYDTSVNIYHAASGNNFKPSPLTIPRGSSCDKANGEYRKFLMKDLHSFSDLPYSENPSDDICAMFVKGKTFTVTDYQFDTNTIPKFMQSGLYKFHITMRKKDVLLCGVEVLFVLS